MNLFKTAPYRKVPFKIVPHRKEHGAGLLRVPSIPVQRGHISSLVLPPHSQPGENVRKLLKLQWWWSLDFVDIYKERILIIMEYQTVQTLQGDLIYTYYFFFNLRMRTFTWGGERWNVMGQEWTLPEGIVRLTLTRETVRAKGGKLKL